jgi:hypothetical protein
MSESHQHVLTGDANVSETNPSIVDTLTADLITQVPNLDTRQWRVARRISKWDNEDMNATVDVMVRRVGRMQPKCAVHSDIRGSVMRQQQAGKHNGMCCSLCRETHPPLCRR